MDNSTRTIIRPITTINIRHDYRLQQNRRTFTNYNKTDGPLPATRKQTGHHLQKSAFAQTTISTNIHTANRIFTNIILMADKHNISKGKMHSNCRLLPEDIVCKITQRNNIRRANTNAIDSNFKKIQTAQNAALRTATGAHKMASIDHLHQESLTLRVKDHSDMLSAQYLVNCLEEDHVSHGITIKEPRPRPMKDTLHSRHHSTVLPRLGSSRMESKQNLHTHVVDSDPRKQQSTWS